LSEEVAARLRARKFAARTVGIKVRFADFRTVTRVRTLPGWRDSTKDIFETAVDLYRGLRLDQPRIRLVGVKCENLRAIASVAEQLTLDVVGDESDEKGGDIRAPGVDAVVDAARERFGPAAVRPGSLLNYPQP
jgi:DNA polymerase-4